MSFLLNPFRFVGDDPEMSWNFTSFSGPNISGDAALMAVSNDGKAYYAHSVYASGSVNTVWYWSNITTSPTASTFSKGADYLSIGVGAYFDGLFWAVGGSTNIYHNDNYNNVYSFNGSTHTARANSPRSTNRLQPASDETTGVYIAPGAKWNSGITDWYRLPTTTGAWESRASLPKSYGQATIAKHADGKILFTALWDDASSSVYKYDLSSNTWSAVSDRPFQANSMTAQSKTFWIYTASNAYSMKSNETTWSAAVSITGTASGYGQIVDNVVYDPFPKTKAA